MSDIQSSIQIIQTTRPQLTMDELVAMQNPVPSFEFNDRDKWFYTVVEDGSFEPGKTLNGNLICVEASLPIEAEQLAMDGLQDSIVLFRSYLSTGAEIVTEQRPVNH